MRTEEAIEHLFKTLSAYKDRCNSEWCEKDKEALKVLTEEFEKQIPKKVCNRLKKEFCEADWAGYGYTRYFCPNCGKPLKNDDEHCHRCGQKVLFPTIRHTPYIEGQAQTMWLEWSKEGDTE